MNAQFFKDNRSKLLANFEGTAPIVIIGNCLMQKSRDTTYEFSQDSSFWYLTGIDKPGFVLVIDNGKQYIISPKISDYQRIFHDENNIDEIIKISGIDKIYEHQEGLERLNKRIRKSGHLATIQPPPSYIEDLYMFTNPSKSRFLKNIFKENPELKLIDLSKILAKMRSQKTLEEIMLIREAIKNTAKLHRLFENKLPDAQNEQELLDEAKKFLLKNRLEFAYEPIIANGVNSITLHYNQNNSELDLKKPTLIDVAVKYDKYNADITRTYLTSPTKRQKQVYNAVFGCQEFAINLLKPGVLLKDYEKEVRQFMGEKLRELGLINSIDETLVSKFYPHATSHFLGIDVHDVGMSDQPLTQNMVLTVEPGIYIADEKIGIRIEDDILITENGAEVLSQNIPK